MGILLLRIVSLLHCLRGRKEVECLFGMKYCVSKIYFHFGLENSLKTAELCQSLSQFTEVYKSVWLVLYFHISNSIG